MRRECIGQDRRVVDELAAHLEIAHPRTARLARLDRNEPHQAGASPDHHLSQELPLVLDRSARYFRIVIRSLSSSFSTNLLIWQAWPGQGSPKGLVRPMFSSVQLGGSGMTYSVKIPVVRSKVRAGTLVVSVTRMAIAPTQGGPWCLNVAWPLAFVLPTTVWSSQ